MYVDITNKEVQTIRRLGNAIDAGTVHVKEVQALLTGLRQKIDTSAAPKRDLKKAVRKDKYKTKLRVAS